MSVRVWRTGRDEVIVKPTNLVVGDYQRRFVPECCIRYQCVVHVGDQVFAETHVFGRVLRVCVRAVLVSKAREYESVRGKIAVADVLSPRLIESSEMIRRLAQRGELQDLIEVVKVSTPGEAGFLKQLIDCF